MNGLNKNDDSFCFVLIKKKTLFTSTWFYVCSSLFRWSNVIRYLFILFRLPEDLSLRFNQFFNSFSFLRSSPHLSLFFSFLLAIRILFQSFVSSISKCLFHKRVCLYMNIYMNVCVCVCVFSWVFACLVLYWKRPRLTFLRFDVPNKNVLVNEIFRCFCLRKQKNPVHEIFSCLFYSRLTMTDAVDTATNNGKVVSTEETHVDGNVLTTVTKSKTVRRRKKQRIDFHSRLIR